MLAIVGATAGAEDAPSVGAPNPRNSADRPRLRSMFEPQSQVNSGERFGTESYPLLSNGRRRPNTACCRASRSTASSRASSGPARASRTSKASWTTSGTRCQTLRALLRRSPSRLLPGVISGAASGAALGPYGMLAGALIGGATSPRSAAGPHRQQHLPWPVTSPGAARRKRCCPGVDRAGCGRERGDPPVARCPRESDGAASVERDVDGPRRRADDADRKRWHGAGGRDHEHARVLRRARLRRVGGALAVRGELRATARGCITARRKPAPSGSTASLRRCRSKPAKSGVARRGLRRARRRVPGAGNRGVRRRTTSCCPSTGGRRGA